MPHAPLAVPALFLARFGGELRDEIMQEIEQRELAAYHQKRNARWAMLISVARRSVDWGILIAFGWMLGKVF